MPLVLDLFSQLFENVIDGLLLSKLVNDIDDTLINVAALHRPPLKTQYQALENHNLCINAAKKLGYRPVHLHCAISSLFQTRFPLSLSSCSRCALLDASLRTLAPRICTAISRNTQSIWCWDYCGRLSRLVYCSAYACIWIELSRVRAVCKDT